MCMRVIGVTLLSVSVCLSVCPSMADLEDGRLLSLQRGMNLNWTIIYVVLICQFLEIWPCSSGKVK